MDRLHVLRDILFLLLVAFLTLTNYNFKTVPPGPKVNRAH